MIPPFITENRRLADLTTFGIGGGARYFAEPSGGDEAAAACVFAQDKDLPLLVLGGGSNLLVADAGVRALVVCLKGGVFSEIEPDASDPLVWRVGAAASLAMVVERAARAGLSGMEFLAGIPGRIGGAAAMNAGGGGAGIGGLIVGAEGVDRGGKRFSLDGEGLAFAYRGSALNGGMTALWLTIRFAGLDSPAAVAERTRVNRERKMMTQPLGFRSAGCVFRNPQGRSAGALLDAAGCKGMREGGAEVSLVHANFIVNVGGAGSGDVARLALRMRSMVMEDSGVVLEPEIRVWGEEQGLPEKE